MKQGAVGDCWLVAAMSTLAVAMPGAIRKLFVNTERSQRYNKSVGCVLCIHVGNKSHITAQLVIVATLLVLVLLIL